jgi:hypothetical protein
MPDDDSSKALLERLCSLQEQHLTLLRDSIERRERFAEREEKLQQAWGRQMSLYEESQKIHEERAERHERSVRIRGIITLVIWAVIAITFIVSRFV